MVIKVEVMNKEVEEEEEEIRKCRTIKVKSNNRQDVIEENQKEVTAKDQMIGFTIIFECYNYNKFDHYSCECLST